MKRNGKIIVSIATAALLLIGGVAFAFAANEENVDIDNSPSVQNISGEAERESAGNGARERGTRGCQDPENCTRGERRERGSRECLDPENCTRGERGERGARGCQDPENCTRGERGERGARGCQDPENCTRGERHENDRQPIEAN